MLSVSFYITNLLLGVALAMDAFSVSCANGLADAKMKPTKAALIAGVFAAFQAAMPMLGWVCVHSLVEIFSFLDVCIPWIALLLLGYLGGSMIHESLRPSGEEEAEGKLTFRVLLMQGVATSIDALSVGFTIADYDVFAAFLASLIIAAVTFVICFAGVYIGKTFGNRLEGKATFIGGVILILIGLEIFITHIFNITLF